MTIDYVEGPVAILLVIYGVVGLIITRGVILDSGLSALQRTIQVIIIWLIPAVGMCIVLLLQGYSHTREEMKRLVPFPFYLAANPKPGDGSLAGFAQDGAEDHYGADGADGD